MTVNLSALAGAGAQFFDNNGVILSGGKLYSYAAGTTTPQTTYTSASGATAHTNPIILNSAGRVATGEIWLTTGSNYKFVLYTSTDVLIATWDNITGINGTGITSNASNVIYNPAGAGAVATTVQTKLRESVSVKDFGATGDGVTDDRAAINAAFAAIIGNGAGTVYFPAGTYRITEFIGNTTSPTAQISIAVIGEVGTEINCDPAVAANFALDLQFANLATAIVKNIYIDCNDKVATGLRVRGLQADGEPPVNLIEIDNVNVNGAKIVNTASITTSARGVSAQANNGVACSITNCYITNVTRDKPGVSQALTAVGFLTTLIANNNIFNVRHDGVSRIDADGIVLFSFNDGTGQYYRQATATVINNRILNCEGRFIKLQTNGNAVVENNTMSIANVIDLITNFTAVDTQVGSATICNNKIQSLVDYTGGTSATVFSLQFASPSNVSETNETFVVRCENNDFYTKTKRIPFGILIPTEPTSTAKMIHIVKNNTFSRDGVIDFTSNAANEAVGRFMRITNTATPATFTGQWILDVGDNKVASNSAFITFAGTNNEDYADKWFFYVYNNFLYSWTGGDVFGTSGGSSPLNNIPYTSTLMVRDNNIGSSSAVRNRVRVPIDVSKILSGCDLETGDGTAPTMTNVPANWNNGRIYKKGRITGAENVNAATAFHYLSTDRGTNWYQV